MHSRASLLALAPSFVATVVAIASCGHPPAPVAASPPRADAPPTASIGPLVVLGWIDDRTSPRDAPLGPDGRKDFSFRVRISGPAAAIVVASSDPQGNPLNDVFDTIVGKTAIPKSLHLQGFDEGERTWQLAINRSDGTAVNPDVVLPPNTVFRDELLTLTASEIWPLFREGRSFSVYVLRPNGVVDRSTTMLLDPAPAP